MQRIAMNERPNWKNVAEEQGFIFHSMHGKPYWDEATAYRFTLAQIENDIEEPSTELHEMCRQAAAKIINSEELMERLDIPKEHWDYVASSWKNGDPELYGRFDLIYDGDGPAKMVEYNADTPTSLYESSAFQWQWLEQMIEIGELPEEADQFNSTFEALSERFAEIFLRGSDVHFASINGEELPEDYATVEMMAWAAKEAGLTAHYTKMEDIGLTTEGQFADNEDRVMGALFKLYPWEDMLRDDFSQYLAKSHCQFLEPAWKSVVSNKGILPVLWEMFEGHPNLLPSFFSDDIVRGAPIAQRSQDALSRGSVRKPVFSREGASITITENGKVIADAEDRSYDDHPMIVQAYHPQPVMGGFRPILGSWVVGTTCVGLGIREDESHITQDLSRFKPHFILD